MRIGRLVWILVVAICGCTRLVHAEASARITFATKEVHIHGTRGVISLAAAGKAVSAGVTVENGAKARSEIAFANGTITRLGSNSSLLLKDGAETMQLRDGAVLFQIPKGSTAQIDTAPISITSKGATGILERHRNLYIKCLLFEGDLRVSIPNQVGESIVLEPGQLIIVNPKATMLPGAVYFNIARAITTCRLLHDFPPLRGGNLMAQAAQEQASLMKSGDYVSAHLVIFGRGTQVHKDTPKVVSKDAKKPAGKKPPGN
jgi:hypothetical protein